MDVAFTDAFRLYAACNLLHYYIQLHVGKTTGNDESTEMCFHEVF